MAKSKTHKFADIVSLQSLVLRPRRRYVLPWEVLPDGTVRFKDCRDKNLVERQMRLWFVVFLWLLVVGFAVGTWLLYIKLQGLPAWLIISLGVITMGFGVVAVWLTRGARCREIDVGLDGSVTVRSPRRRGEVDLVPDCGPGRLEIRPVRVSVQGARWKGYGLMIRNGRSTVMLAADGTIDGCLDALAKLPVQVGGLPLESLDRFVVAADGVDLMITQAVWQ